MRNKTLGPAPGWREIADETNKLADGAQEEIAEHIQDWMLFEYQDKPHPTLKLYTDGAGNAMLTIHRLPGGTVKAKGPESLIRMLPSGDWQKAARQHVSTNLETWYTARALRKNTPQTTAVALQWSQDLTKRISKAANDALRERMARSSHNGELQEDRTKTAKDLRQILRSEIFDSQVTHLTGKYYKNRFTLELPGLSEYNHVMRNRKVFEQMDRESPHTLTYHCRVLQHKPNAQTPRLRSAERTTRAVQASLDASHAEWRLFTRIGINDTNPEPHICRERTQAGLKAIVSANVPEAGLKLHKMMMHEGRLYHEISSQQWRHGDPARALAHLINVSLHHGIQNPQDPAGPGSAGYDAGSRWMNEFRHILHALQWHVQRQQPWGPTNREAYWRRTARWQQEINRQRTSEMELRMAEANWESLVGETTAHGITAMPVCGGLKLRDTAREMSNCLQSMMIPCLEGYVRIFTLHDGNGDLAAAGELRLEKDRWTTEQVEGPKRADPGQKCRRAMDEVRDRYNAAWKNHAPQTGG